MEPSSAIRNVPRLHEGDNNDREQRVTTKGTDINLENSGYILIKKDKLVTEAKADGRFVLVKSH